MGVYHFFSLRGSKMGATSETDLTTTQPRSRHVISDYVATQTTGVSHFPWECTCEPGFFV